MKTDFRKWLPVMVMTVAAAGAFTTNAMSVKANDHDLVQGFVRINNSETNCVESDECLNVHTEIDCMVDGTQVYAKDEFGSCNIKLYRPEP